MALFQSKSQSKSGANELKKLKRQDVLELLLEQMHEGDDLRNTVARLEVEVEGLNDLTERLKKKLDDKDETIERLRRRLDIKDKMIAVLMAQGRELPKSDELFDLAELLEVESRAVEAYIEGLYQNLGKSAAAVDEPSVEEDGTTEAVAYEAAEGAETAEAVAADEPAEADEVTVPDEPAEAETDETVDVAVNDEEELEG